MWVHWAAEAETATVRSGIQSWGWLHSSEEESLELVVFLKESIFMWTAGGPWTMRRFQVSQVKSRISVLLPGVYSDAHSSLRPTGQKQENLDGGRDHWERGNGYS